MGKAGKSDQLQQKSPAEFFAENKNIAGFDNVRACLHTCLHHLNHTQPGRCLYTTVRELVENSLDAAESIKQLPSLEITMCATRLLHACCSHTTQPVRRSIRSVSISSGVLPMSSASMRASMETMRAKTLARCYPLSHVWHSAAACA